MIEMTNIIFKSIYLAFLLYFVITSFKCVITIEAMSSCLVNTVQLTTNADRQLLIAFVSSSYLYEISRISNKIDNFM